MAVKRMVARKVHIPDITKGSWVRKEGFEPSYIETERGEHVSRARILATVVDKFVSEDQSFASITLDDGRDTIRAKVFQDTTPLSHVKAGDVIDVIGKIREYNGEIYINLESALVVEDPNHELLRRLEIAKQRLSKKSLPPGKEEDRETVRKRMLEAIEAEKEGITFEALLEKANVPEELAESIINELLGEGICYEPSPGKIRKI